MNSLQAIRGRYLEEGVDYLNASAKTCQDIILQMISASSLKQHVTLKGGVVMQHLSKDIRRATQDIDLDFIRYSLSDDMIRNFIQRLNDASGSFVIAINGPIEPLKHQDYQGKRLHIRISDQQGTVIDTKLDIGVHKDLQIEQEDYCFDLAKLDDAVTLLINSKEQMIAEKLKSLLRLGVFSTRYKDFFDLYYLSSIASVDCSRLQAIMQVCIFDDNSMHENNQQEVTWRLEQVLNSKRFLSQVKLSRKDWLELPVEDVATALLHFFAQLHG